MCPRSAVDPPDTQLVRVWDPALRLFHWMLALAIAGGIVTGEIGGAWIEWHARLGVLISALLGFRLAWGVFGPPTARFANFVRGPAAIGQYLRGEWVGVGHTPVGALAVIALLGLTLLQLGSGLISNDDIDFQGPMASLVSSTWSNRASGIHQKLSWLLIGMVAVHVLAIAWYRLVRGHDLIRPMLNGLVRVPRWALGAAAGARRLPSAPAEFDYPRLLLAVAIGLGSAALASGSLLTAFSRARQPPSLVSPNTAPPAPAW